MQIIRIFILVVHILFFSIGAAQESSSQATGTISFIGVGDIMMGNDYPARRALLPPRNGKFLFSKVDHILKQGDIVFGNLEGVVTDGGKCRKNINRPLTYAFRTPTRYAINLKNAGFNIMSVSNNHIFDFGYKGYQKTLRTLKKNNIKYTGPKNHFPHFTIQGKTITVIAFSPYNLGYNLLHIKKSKKLIKKLSKKYDIVIVTFHGGTEGTRALHTRYRMERIGRELRGNVIKFSRSMIDSGADLIIGHGPHVPRAIELYKNKLIVYSLGNFCTYGGMSLKGVKGYAPIIKVLFNHNGNFVSGKIFAFQQKKPGYPIEDPNNRTILLMKRLTEQDFPKTSIKITKNGDIIKK